ncbi:hypothetical protein ABZ543_09675 [Streptomyces roseifaciens]
MTHRYLTASGIEGKPTQTNVTALAHELKRPGATAASVAEMLRDWSK